MIISEHDLSFNQQFRKCLSSLNFLFKVIVIVIVIIVIIIKFVLTHFNTF